MNEARTSDPFGKARCYFAPVTVSVSISGFNKPRSTVVKNVGLVGFEPTASASRTQRSTKLSHSPNFLATHPPVSGSVVAQRPYFAHFTRPGK